MEDSKPRSVLLPALSTDSEFSDSDFFWDAHWKKIAVALVVIILGILATGAWAYLRASAASASAAFYAAATGPEAWSEVVAKYPGSLSAGNAQLRIAASLRSEGKLDEAVATLEQFTSAQPDHPLAGAAWLAIGEIRQLQKNTSAALEAYRTSSGRYQSSYSAPLALLAEARLLATENKSGESKAILESIGTSYPEGPAAMVAAAELSALSDRSKQDAPAP